MRTFCDTCGKVEVEPEDDHCENCCTLTEREYWYKEHDHSEEDYPGRQIQDA